ncbi:hypothetical protein [Marinobacter maritimus]|uniref:hypothetical protein n=1 Tax=Marinobacter maritimus TaxID=277961 RepID=UPI00119D0A24|nr:hypothetical protein [Marinobacter maritimus]
MTQAKTKNLVITNLKDEHRQDFLDWADALELTRDQFFVALMVNAGFADGGLEAFLPDKAACEEWRELLARRMIQLANA